MNHYKVRTYKRMSHSDSCEIDAEKNKNKANFMKIKEIKIENKRKGLEKDECFSSIRLFRDNPIIYNRILDSHSHKNSKQKLSMSIFKNKSINIIKIKKSKTPNRQRTVMSPWRIE